MRTVLRVALSVLVGPEQVQLAATRLAGRTDAGGRQAHTHPAPACTSASARTREDDGWKYTLHDNNFTLKRTFQHELLKSEEERSYYTNRIFFALGKAARSLPDSDFDISISFGGRTSSV